MARDLGVQFNAIPIEQPKPSSGDTDGLSQASGLLVRSQAAREQMFQRQTQEAQAEAELANKPSTIAKETGKGVLSSLVDPLLKGAATVGGAIKEQFTGEPTTEFTGILGEQKPTYQGELEAGERESVPGALASTALDVSTALPLGKGVQLAKQGVKSVLKKTGVADFFAQRAMKKAEEKAVGALKSTRETMTKKERQQAIEEGRQVSANIGDIDEFMPSETESRAAKILSNKISSDPVKNVPLVQREIKTVSKDAENYLEKNAKAITNEEDLVMFQQKRIESEKYMTPAAVNAYDEQIKIFQRVLKDFGEYTTPNYYKALKEYETKVTANLSRGKEALLDEGGVARLQAAKDVRHVVRDMIGQKNPEFKERMFDIASLYDALDNVIIKAEQAGGKGKITRFIEKNPKTSAAIGIVVGSPLYEKAKDIIGVK